jgi:hypothetical protein
MPPLTSLSVHELLSGRSLVPAAMGKTFQPHEANLDASWKGAETFFTVRTSNPPISAKFVKPKWAKF